jgi:uncharacterized protein YoxC
MEMMLTVSVMVIAVCMLALTLSAVATGRKRGMKAAGRQDVEGPTRGSQELRVKITDG